MMSRCLLPSPWHARLGLLGLSADNLTRRQDSRDVAARALAPSVEALDAPLGADDLASTLGPATERIGAYSGGTCTRRSGAASLDATCQHSSRCLAAFFRGLIARMPDLKPVDLIVNGGALLHHGPPPRLLRGGRPALTGHPHGA